MRTCEDGCNGCDHCTDHYDDGDFGGPTPEEWAWLDANARGASDKLRERISDLEKGLNEWRELALSQAGDAGIVARMVKAETALSLLRAVDDWVKADAARFRQRVRVSLDALAALGGFEIATMVGAVLQAAHERTVLDLGRGLYRNHAEFMAVAKEAERFYRNGPPFLQRYLPFWLAVLVDRLIVLLVPVIALLIPLLIPLAGKQERTAVESGLLAATVQIMRATPEIGPNE